VVDDLKLDVVERGTLSCTFNPESGTSNDAEQIHSLSSENQQGSPFPFHESRFSNLKGGQFMKRFFILSIVVGVLVMGATFASADPFLATLDEVDVTSGGDLLNVKFELRATTTGKILDSIENVQQWNDGTNDMIRGLLDWGAVTTKAHRTKAKFDCYIYFDRGTGYPPVPDMVLRVKRVKSVDNGDTVIRFLATELQNTSGNTARLFYVDTPEVTDGYVAPAP